MSENDPDLWFSFVRAHRLMIRAVEARLAAADLPAYSWYDVLWGLESGPGGKRRMHELADALAIERYNLTRLVDRLEKEGLVTRTRSSTDGRGAYVSITKKGQLLRKKIWKVYKGTVSDFFLSEFDKEEQRAVSAALDRVTDTVKMSQGKL